MRCAIYARVSTTDKGQDTENQLQQCKKLALEKQWQIVEIYTENVSGTGRKKRPVFEKMMNDARQHKFNVLLVWAYDRFSRGGLVDLKYISELHKIGIKFVSLQEPFLDMTSETGELLLSIFAWIAKQEAHRLSERTKAGLFIARQNGKQIGRREISFDEQKMLSLRANGMGWRTIAKELGVSHVVVIKRHRKLTSKALPEIDGGIQSGV
jgi:DNA invertase Pin-like site-specific DNA recombinase